MEKEKITKEFLQAMWCALNCATDNDSQIRIMNLMEKYGGSAMPKWRDYISQEKDIFANSLKDMEKILKSQSKG